MIAGFGMLLGLVLLVAGAEFLVRGAAQLAARLGVAPLTIGLTVVAFGTSAPELAISVGSSLEGQAEIALGNVVGSNIFNVLFILGACALILPLVVSTALIRRDVPIMIGASLLVLLLAADGELSRSEGLLLVAGLVGYIYMQFRQGRDSSDAEIPEIVSGALPRQLLAVLLGLILLVAGARVFVNGAVSLAQMLGVSELVIGLTIVAAGTSLPEVATSIMASIRGQRDIAVGNVIGSNIFNLLCVLGAALLVAPAPLQVSQQVLLFDLPVMLMVAVVCLPIFFTGYQVSRAEGALFLTAYLAYTSYLVLLALGHPPLPMLQSAALFVVPMAVLTLGAVLLHRSRSRL